MDATERRRLGMLQHAAGFLRSFAGDRPGAVAWVARGIATTLRDEAGGDVTFDLGPGAVGGENRAAQDWIAEQVRQGSERRARMGRPSS